MMSLNVQGVHFFHTVDVAFQGRYCMHMETNAAQPQSGSPWKPINIDEF